MYTKKNARVTFRSSRRSNFKRNNNYSVNKPRNKGNVIQQYNKYLKLAKEFSSSGDRIQSEYYYQFTDHYYRLMSELGITLEGNEIETDNKSSNDTNQENQVSSDTNPENQVSNENSNDKKDSEDNGLKATSDSSDSEDVDSIESIPFMAEPAKKKSTRTKKATA